MEGRLARKIKKLPENTTILTYLKVLLLSLDGNEKAYDRMSKVQLSHLSARSIVEHSCYGEPPRKSSYYTEHSDSLPLAS